MYDDKIDMNQHSSCSGRLYSLDILVGYRYPVRIGRKLTS